MGNNIIAALNKPGNYKSIRRLKKITVNCTEMVTGILYSRFIARIPYMYLVIGDRTPSAVVCAGNL